MKPIAVNEIRKVLGGKILEGSNQLESGGRHLL